MKKFLALALISLCAHADIGLKETTYERVYDDEATIIITNEGGGYVHVKGTAFWVNQTGIAHIGELDNTVKVKNGVAFYKHYMCNLKLVFENKTLIVSGDKDSGGECGGMNVNFNGHYEITTQENLIYSSEPGKHAE